MRAPLFIILNLFFIAFDGFNLTHTTARWEVYYALFLGFQIGMFIWAMALWGNERRLRREAKSLEEFRKRLP